MPAEEKILTSAGIFYYVPWEELFPRHLFFLLTYSLYAEMTRE